MNIKKQWNESRNAMKRLRPDIPAPGEQFLRAIGRKMGKETVYREWRQRLGHFYNWLDTVHLTPQEVLPADFDRFERYLRDLDLHYGTRLRTVQRVRIYYQWLKRKGHFQGIVTELIPAKPSRLVWRVKLPIEAKEYLALIATQKTSATCAAHATQLRRFYCFLATQPPDILFGFSRPQWQNFLKYLCECALFAETTRRHSILNVRAYLYWLYEQNKVSFDPYTYCRISDSPKIPYRLPRPLDPLLDHKLQNYLENSEEPYRRAFFIMRHSGIRIGELRDLSFDCLRIDANGNVQLKVPLGKLGSERMVPLAAKAVAAIKAIQVETAQYFLHSSRLGSPSHLLMNSSGLRPQKINLAFAFVDISNKFSPGVRIYPHQLRHSYATTLLNAGLSLTALRDLLGHRSVTMTLRYAAITHDKLNADYQKALIQMEARYQMPALHSKSTDQPDFSRALLDLCQFLKKVDRPDSKRRTRHLIERIQTLRRDLLALLE